MNVGLIFIIKIIFNYLKFIDFLSKKEIYDVVLLIIV